MDFQVDPAFEANLLAMARPKLERACISLKDYIRTVKLSKGRRGQGDVLTEGEPPYAYFGKLRNSVNQRWKEGDPNTQQVGVFSNDPKKAEGNSAMVASVQEMGANIAGKGKHLTVPRSEEAVAFMKKPGASAINFPRKLVPIRSHRNPSIFYLVEERRGGSRNPRRTEIHFILVKNVRIPPHPFILPSLTEHGPEMMRIMGS